MELRLLVLFKRIDLKIDFSLEKKTKNIFQEKITRYDFVLLNR
jgi:hypothetical protein